MGYGSCDGWHAHSWDNFFVTEGYTESLDIAASHPRAI
jgi:hypothetical protein